MESGDQTSRRPRRVAVGCTACRVRRVKCDENKPSCASCIKAGIDCVRTLHVRFRRGLDAPDGVLCFPAGQVWLQPNGALEYHDETAELSRIYETGEADMEETLETREQLAEHLVQFAHDCNHPRGTLAEKIRSLGAGGSSDMGVTYEANFPEGASPRESPSYQPITRHLRSNTSLEFSPVYNSSPSSQPVVPFTPREAVLVRNFTENMALWSDATDLQRHFEIEVPQRCLYFPVLRYAVFAFSSRHANRHNPDTSTEALEYYDRCLSLLIEEVSNGNELVDEETLAAITILRQYEEMDADDKELHLNGTSRIVNSMSPFDFNGGLGEAAAWLCLRQDIYISLVRQRPLRSKLDTYLQSDVFKRHDDAAYANKMVYLLAKALSCAFPAQASQPSGRSLEDVTAEVDEWFDSRSPAFNPIYEAKRNRAGGRLLPEVWLLSPFHAVGLQYYHIAKIALAMSTPLDTSSVLENIRQGRRVEQTVRNHLFQIIALASSHARAENALFTARHSLSIWGSFFAEEDDQAMVLDFLDHVQQRTGWNTFPLRSSLKEQWVQDHGVRD